MKFVLQYDLCESKRIITKYSLLFGTGSYKKESEEKRNNSCRISLFHEKRHSFYNFTKFHLTVFTIFSHNYANEF